MGNPLAFNVMSRNLQSIAKSTGDWHTKLTSATAVINVMSKDSFAKIK